MLHRSHRAVLVWCTTTLLALVALAPNVRAQGPDDSGDDSWVDRPDEAIDFPGCYNDLNTALIATAMEYGKRICFSTDALTLQQTATFNTLACICRGPQDNARNDCCLGDTAQIPTAGASMAERRHTPKRISSRPVCQWTDATLDRVPPAASTLTPVPEPSLTPDPSDSDIHNMTCLEQLHRADGDKDNQLSLDEYLVFVHAFGKHRCFYTTSLTLAQQSAFDTLSCVCNVGVTALYSSDCGTDDTVEPSMALSSPHRTQDTWYHEHVWQLICTTTNATMETECPPVVAAVWLQ